MLSSPETDVSIMFKLVLKRPRETVRSAGDADQHRADRRHDVAPRTIERLQR